MAVKDHLAVSDLAIAAYERAREPKKLVLLPGGHFDAYVKEFDQSFEPARDWFRTHLGRGPVPAPRGGSRRGEAGGRQALIPAAIRSSSISLDPSTKPATRAPIRCRPNG